MLDYLRRTRRVTPEFTARAEQLINLGYQRLLTFEAEGGGFSWFGGSRANFVLSAYALQEFSDLARVVPIDEKVIERTRAFILERQDEKEGCWAPGEGEGIWDWSSMSGKFVVTAYVAWSLAEAGEKGPAVGHALGWLKAHVEEVAGNPYALALAANALVAAAPEDPATRSVLERLAAAGARAAGTGGMVWGAGGGATVTSATGDAAANETTALAALAFLKGGERYLPAINAALSHLAQARGSNGTWGSTSATILALRVLVRGLAGVEQKGTVELEFAANGVKKGVTIAPDQGDVMQVVDFKEAARRGANEVTVDVKGESGMTCQLLARYWLPWEEAKEPGTAAGTGATGRTAASEPIGFAVTYDRQEVAVGEVVQAEAKVTWRGEKPTFMVVLELGIPPGFDVDGSDFAGLVGSGIERYEQGPRQVTVYLGEVQPGAEVKIPYGLRARYPMKVRTPASRAYEFYTPAHRAEAGAVELEVRD